MCHPPSIRRATINGTFCAVCRALDNLLYVVALNQYNEHFFGRSCIADPCGLIVSKVSDQEGIMYGILDMNYQQTVRSQVPTYQNRRPELYEVK